MMKFKRTTYPDYTGAGGSPCWNLTARYLWADADWNSRFPFGTSLGVRLQRPGCILNKGPGFTLDINPPLGEPNRVYLFLGRWHVIIGLPSVRSIRETGRTRAFRGQEIPVAERFSDWRHPHIDGCSRYRYHKDEHGNWVRDDKPARMHWGWLTIEKREGSYTGS